MVGKLKRSLDKLEMPPSVSVCGFRNKPVRLMEDLILIVLERNSSFYYPLLFLNKGYCTILLRKTVAHDEGFLDFELFEFLALIRFFSKIEAQPPALCHQFTNVHCDQNH